MDSIQKKDNNSIDCIDRKVPDSLKMLNNEQLKPALETEGVILVSAGAGSGKTRLLTQRIAHLISDLHVSPYNILAITFTNKAANEMKQRIEKIVDAEGMWISTFHSMCCKMLRIHASSIGFSNNFTIYADEEKERILKRAIANIGADITVSTVSWHISQAKNKMMDVETYRGMITATKNSKEICDIFQIYEEECKQNNALDFDDLLLKTLEMFKTNPDICIDYAKRFKYVHVDEFQDTNLVQYEIVKCLSSSHKNLFVVGDEDQCIYTWRGAEADNMKKLEKDYPNVQVFKLEQNYRSTKKILEPANKLITNNTERHDKVLWTENEEGIDITNFTAYSDIEEAEYVASTIKRLTGSSTIQNKDIAILMRVNALSRKIEEKMLAYGISHQIFGGFKFFERKEVKDALAYLKLLSNPQDNEAFIRVCAFPKKGIGEKAIQELYIISGTSKKSMFDCVMTGEDLSEAQIKKYMPIRTMYADIMSKMQGFTLFELADYVIKLSNIKDAIGNKTEEDTTKQMNVDDLLHSVKQFDEDNENATLSDYLASITLVSDSDKIGEDDSKVSIMTVHSAKGLEFPVVFVIGLTDGTFPLQRAIYSTDKQDLEEERRLMYVAMTRAEKRLYLTHPKSKFSFETRATEIAKESRFLKEIRGGDQIVDATEIEDFERTTNSVYKQRGESTGEQYFSKRTQIVEKHVSVDAFQKGDRVRHKHFGEGVVTIPVTDPNTMFITVKFDIAGIKTLSLKFAPLEKL